MRIHRSSAGFTVILVGVIIMLATAITVVAAGEFLGSGAEEEFDQPTVIFDEEDLRSVPSLSAEEKDRVTDISLSDKRIKALLDGRSLQVTDVTLWTGRENRLIGAVITLSLDEPATLDGEWVAFSWDCTKEPVPLPTRVAYDAQFANVSEILVFANLETGEVDQIIPSNDAGEVQLIGEADYGAWGKKPTTCGD